MKTPELNEKVKAKLLEYDSLEPITTSQNWDSELIMRLQLMPKSKTIKTVNYTLFLVSLAFINCLIIVFSLVKTPEKQTAHNTNLQVISNELLITNSN